MTLTLSTHILNLASGEPAAGVAVSVSHASDPARPLARAVTDADGRISQWPGDPALAPGNYLLDFDVATWFEARGEACFYTRVCVEFKADSERHYHVPLLLNRYGYSTYRGS